MNPKPINSGVIGCGRGVGKVIVLVFRGAAIRWTKSFRRFTCV